VAKASFEWDRTKDLENQDKHGISFSMAQLVFADPFRVIAEDLSHSTVEKRYYCFGLVEGGVLTVSVHIPQSCHSDNRGRLLEKREATV
jgi:uncharacterized DUF497 family protein